AEEEEQPGGAPSAAGDARDAARLGRLGHVAALRCAGRDADAVVRIADAALALDVVAARFPVLAAKLADVVLVAERASNVADGGGTRLAIAGELDALALGADAVDALVVVRARVAQLHERRHHLPASRLVDGNLPELSHLSRPFAAIGRGDRAHALLEVVAVDLGRSAVDGIGELRVDFVGRVG